MHAYTLGSRSIHVRLYRVVANSAGKDHGKYGDGLLRLDQCSHVTVMYWFHKNDTPQKRSILQVHPRGNKDNPLTGVFATHSQVRPNLIAISRVKVISVKGNIIEIEKIDAFDDSPVIDIKS